MSTMTGSRQAGSPGTRLAWCLVLFMTFSGGAGAQGLDRLFTSVEQRQQLDLARREAANAPVVDDTPKKATQTQRVQPVTGSLTVNGIVIRSSGYNTSWVNGDQVSPGGLTPDGLAVERGSHGMRIRLPSGIDTVELAPGQKIDVSSGVVLDAYEQQVTADSTSAFDLDGSRRRYTAPTSAKDGDAATASQAVPTVRALESNTPSALSSLRRLLERAFGEEPDAEVDTDKPRSR